MNNKLKRNFARYSTLASLVFGAGCSYIETAPKPDVTEGYPTISHQSTAILEKPDEKINVEIIHDKTKKLPIYSGKQFESNLIGNYEIIRYHPRNIDSNVVKKTLEEQLNGDVEAISSVEEINQVLIKIRRNDIETTSGLENHVTREQIYETLKSLDIKPPQIMLNMRIVKTFADYTKDLGFFFNSSYSGKDGVYPEISINIPGASVRVPERAAEKGLGAQYGLVGEIGRYFLDVKIDHLESQGIAKDVARPTVLVASGKAAEIKLTQELPYQDEVLQGGALLALTKFKPVETFLKVTPTARDDGNIYLDINSGVGSFNPTGVLQVPGIVTREIKIDGVYVPQGNTLIIAGMRIDHTLGIERKDPLLSKVPILGKIIPWGDDKEKNMQEILFIVTPEYVDVNQNPDILEK